MNSYFKNRKVFEKKNCVSYNVGQNILLKTQLFPNNFTSPKFMKWKWWKAAQKIELAKKIAKTIFYLEQFYTWKKVLREMQRISICHLKNRIILCVIFFFFLNRMGSEWKGFHYQSIANVNVFPYIALWVECWQGCEALPSVFFRNVQMENDVLNNLDVLLGVDIRKYSIQ